MNSSSTVLAAALIVVVGHLAAQEPVLRLSPGITAPFVLRKTKPDYTDEAMLAKLEGSVLLSVTIDPDGSPRDFHVDRPLGLGLDESAIESVRAWKFRPGTKAGMAVAVRVNEEVFFHVERNLWDWHLVRAVFAQREGLIRPRVTKVKFPLTTAVEENASVTVAFDVAPNGAPINATVLKSSNPKWEDQVLAALKGGWRFEPAKQNGKPIATRAWFEFVRGSHSPIPPVRIPPE